MKKRKKNLKLLEISYLNNIKKFAKQRSDRLSYLANGIKNLSDILLSIQRNKVNHGSR